MANRSNMAKNRPYCAWNRVARSTSVTNSVFLLAIVATPIDYTYCLILLMPTLSVGKGRQHKSKVLQMR